jgi:hypothetical protein
MLCNDYLIWTCLRSLLFLELDFGQILKNRKAKLGAYKFLGPLLFRNPFNSKRKDIVFGLMIYINFFVKEF